MICGSCRIEKPLNEYPPSTFKPHGGSSCRPCRRAAGKRWSDKNRDKTRAYARTYYAKHPYSDDPQRGKAQKSAYYLKNKERLNAAVREHRKENRSRYRDYDLRKYGIGLKKFADMESAQNGLCAICGNPPKRGPLHVDHCHVSGKIRGLLCNHCNVAIGMFRDDPSLVLKGYAYLTSWFPLVEEP